MRDADKRNFTIIGSTKGYGEKESDNGIISGHAYTVTSVYDLPVGGLTKLEKPTRLVKLVNPWGKGEWNGDWSDNSP